jgi:hypothetical protein
VAPGPVSAPRRALSKPIGERDRCVHVRSLLLMLTTNPCCCCMVPGGIFML